MATIWDESKTIWDDDYAADEELIEPTAPESVDPDEEWLKSIQTYVATEEEQDEFANLRSDSAVSSWIPPKIASYAPPVSQSAEAGSSSGSFAGIFKNEGARTGQPTNLNSSAVGRGQMIKGTREAMYKKLGFADMAAADHKFRTDPDFEMKVMNAYRSELDARIPSNVQGKQREYMIAKGWYTGDPFYDDNKVPGKSAGNRLTAGQYASRAVGMQYGGVNNLPEDIASQIQLEYPQPEIEIPETPIPTLNVQAENVAPANSSTSNDGSQAAGIADTVVNGVNKFRQVKDKLNKIGAQAAQSVSDAIDIQAEIAGNSQNDLSLRKFNERKNLKRYSINKTPLNQPLIFT